MAQAGYTPIQLYRSSTAAATPSAGNLQDGELAINTQDEVLFFKNAAGTVKRLAASVTLAVNGGTGQTSYAVGDLLYANTTTTLAKLADVATGNALISGGVGVAPSYGKIGLTTHVSGTLPAANGGTGITALGTGVATWLGTPSSANLAAAVTGETGSGALVFATSPTLVTPILGTPTSGTLTNCSGLPLGTGVTGTLAVANGGTGQTTYTNGQLLIGNTTGNTLNKATLTAGSGISITNGSGSITIASSVSSGALVYLSTVSASVASTVDVETGFSSTYDEYLIIGSNISLSTPDALTMRFKIGGSYIATSTYYGGSDKALVITTTDSATAFSIRLYAVNSSSPKVSTIEAVGVDSTAGPALRTSNTGVGNSNTGTLSGVRFLANNGVATITGTFKLYGIANA